MILVLYHSFLSRLMTLLRSLAQRQSGSASIWKEKARRSSLVVCLLLRPVSGVSPAGLPQPHGTRRAPRLLSTVWGKRCQGSGDNFPHHILSSESDRGVVLACRKDPKHGLQHGVLGRFDLWETPLFQLLGPTQ